MEILFKNLIPHPLKDYPHAENSIWGKEFTLYSPKKYLLNAASGKGKTTFTHILAGIRKDFEGNVEIDKQKITSFNSSKWTEFRKQKISFVFQDLQLFPHLSVKENFLVKNNLSNSFNAEEILNFLKIVGLEEKFEQKCALLSMGQQQRIAIIRALLQPFEILVLDEPFSHLDKVNTEICLNLINQRVNELNAGIVLTSLGEHYDFNFDDELFL
ncbi:MAG: ATP-binding cassette domain-containing protein [Flavobacteriia bacterium]|nr:ATP-binding cassette domain-containing protein [Flavobacteriia bacterium]